MTGIVLIVSFLLLLSLGMPISLSMGFSAMLSMLTGGYDVSQICVLVQRGVSNYTLVAIPYFVLAANIMNTGGITNRIVNWADAIVGWMRGGLAQVNVIGSVIFAGISGTSSADAAGLGLIEITAMRQKGYDLGWSTSITLASSLLGPIIPPSTAFIVYAILAEVSVTDMFLAGIIPGVVMAIVMMVMNYYIARKGKVSCPEPEPFSIKILWKATKDGFFALMAPIVLLVCIFSGAVTATEAGIVCVLYSAFASALYREFKLNNIKKALYDTVISCSVIMILIGFGSVIGWILSIERVPAAMTNLMLSLSDNKYVLLILINILLLILGMFIDSTTIRIITVPLLLPLIDTMGVSRIQFGVFHSLNCLIGTCTPPVGTGLMIMTSLTKQKFSSVVRAFMPYFIPLIICLLAVTFIPFLSTWLPGLF